MLALFHFEIFVKGQRCKAFSVFKNSIWDAHSAQPRDIVLNIMRHKSSETMQWSGHFQSSLSRIKVQKMSTQEMKSEDKLLK